MNQEDEGEGKESEQSTSVPQASVNEYFSIYVMNILYNGWLISCDKGAVLSS